MIEQEKQILSAYIDGTLSSTKKEEFEKMLRIRADLQEEVMMKRAQISKLTGFIPKVSMPNETRDNLEREIKSTISQLIEEKEESLWVRLKQRFFSR